MVSWDIARYSLLGVKLVWGVCSSPANAGKVVLYQSSSSRDKWKIQAFSKCEVQASSKAKGWVYCCILVTVTLQKWLAPPVYYGLVLEKAEGKERRGWVTFIPLLLILG